MLSKKVLVILKTFSFLIAIGSINSSNAFLDTDLGLDLYKNIDTGIYELELKAYQYEITNGGKLNLGDKFNFVLGLNCVKSNVSISSIEKIENLDNDLAIKECLDKVIKPNCKENEKDTSINTFLDVCVKVGEINKDFKDIAAKKTDSIFKVSRVGIYSDGTTANSPFDIVKDMENIDSVIFASKNRYEGVESNLASSNSYGNFYGSLLNGVNNTVNNTTNTGTTPGINTGVIVNPIIFTGTIDIDNGRYVCSDNNDLGGIDIDILINSLSTWSLSNTGDVSLISTYSYRLPRDYTRFAPIPSTMTGNYSKLTDNGLWKCDTWFCIIIEFKMYNHKLLGGSDNKTIEAVVLKSNEHVYKFTTTGMGAKKMSTNNWECSICKSLGLPESFNMNVIITKKSPPILNIDKNNTSKTKDINSPFSSQNLLYEYYKNSGLDYGNANSIEIFKKVLPEQKSIVDSVGLNASDSSRKIQSYEDTLTELQKNNDKVARVIDMRVRNDDLKSFYDMFIELKVFTEAVRVYSEGLKGVIQKMADKQSGS